MASPTAASGSAVSIPRDRSTQIRPRRRADDLFFGAMALFIVGSVFLGFARTYYLAGIYHAHVRSLLIQVHGAVFSTWILLLAVQTTLVARNNISLHRRLGFFGAGLAVAMVGLGIAAATDSLSRSFAPPGFPFGPLAFYARPISAIATFAVLIFFSIRLRSNGPAHKRLVLLATLTLIGAAIDRWPFAFIQKSHSMTNVILDLLVLSIVIFDLSTLRRIHRATLLGGLLVAATTHLAVPIGTTPGWQKIATFALHVWNGMN